MKDFKFAKECSEKGIEFKGCKEFKVELCLTKEIRDVNCFWIEAYENKENINVYPNPSEEDLSKRLPKVIKNDILNKEQIEKENWKFHNVPFFCLEVKVQLSITKIITIRLSYIGESFSSPYNRLIDITGNTTKECYQKAIILLNDMELLK